MNRQCGRRSFYLNVAGAVTALLLTGTLARAQSFYQLDWGSGPWNMSVGNETNQPVSVFIYQGFDLSDPTAGGGLVLLGTTNTTITVTAGDLVTIPLNPPVDVNTGDIFYAAVMIPGVPSGGSGKYPWWVDTMDSARNTTPLGRSFFDVGLGDPGSGQGGSFDVTKQIIANITPFGQVHPVLGGGPNDVVEPGNLSLWVRGALP